jgi:hypothetical protein
MRHPDRDLTMERMYRQGDSLREIATKFPGISFQRVHQILKARGVKMRNERVIHRWTESENATLRRLHSKGLTFQQAAALIGRGRNACIGRAHRMGLVSR